jgi:hypothetical protein
MSNVTTIQQSVTASLEGLFGGRFKEQYDKIMEDKGEEFAFLCERLSIGRFFANGHSFLKTLRIIHS